MRAFNNLIDTVMFLYILSLYLLIYRAGLNQISNLIALLLVFLIMIYVLVSNKKLVLNKFLISYLIFLAFCLISSFFAINQDAVIERVITLGLIYILMIALVNYIDSFDKLQKLLRHFVYSGFFASLYVLIISDFSNLTRFGSELGNVNAVGLIIGISSIFCFYFILEKDKSLIYIPILLTNLGVILLTGSRKSLFFILLSFLIILLSKKNSGIKGKFKAIVWSSIIIFTSIYLIYNVPFFYKIIGVRMDELFTFISSGSSADSSVNTRAYMIDLGLNWFKEKPLTGYGLNNYQFLFGNVSGWYTYSHNNLIELLVGIGVLGALSFYYTHILVLHDLFKAAKYRDTLSYSFIAIIGVYTLLSVGMVYYYDKHISIILVVGSLIYKFAKLEDSLN